MNGKRGVELMRSSEFKQLSEEVSGTVKVRMSDVMITFPPAGLIVCCISYYFDPVSPAQDSPRAKCTIVQGKHKPRGIFPFPIPIISVDTKSSYTPAIASSPRLHVPETRSGETHEQKP